MGKENPIGPGTIDGNRFTFGGRLRTAVGVTAYVCEGEADDGTIAATVSTAKGKMRLKGTRR